MTDPMQRAPVAGRGAGSRLVGTGQQSQGNTHAADSGPVSSPSLFDADRSRLERDQAVAAVSANTHTAWKLYAERVVRELAATGQPFTAEQVRERTGHPLASHHNAMGAVLSSAAKRGEIEPAGYTQATRPEAHARVLRVWKGT